MAFNPQAIDDAIRNAGALLHEQWKKPGSANMPENDLHPDASGLQFRLKLLEDKCSLLEDVLGQCVREIKGLKNGR